MEGPVKSHYAAKKLSQPVAAHSGNNKRFYFEEDFSMTCFLLMYLLALEATVMIQLPDLGVGSDPYSTKSLLGHPYPSA